MAGLARSSPEETERTFSCTTSSSSTVRKNWPAGLPVSCRKLEAEGEGGGEMEEGLRGRKGGEVVMDLGRCE
jgi:hypothetical protein